MSSLAGWSTAAHPHIAILGENPSRRRRAIDRVLAHLHAAPADEIRP